MASYINQSKLWGILCVAFILVSGFITLEAVPPGPTYRCAGRKDCLDDQKCTNYCTFFGYDKGGRCVGYDPQSKMCCCIM
ncbi:unnamed protein product [Lathyrus oleraceus]